DGESTRDRGSGSPLARGRQRSQCRAREHAIRNPRMPPAASPPTLTVRAIRSVGVEVPMTYALGTSRGTITKAPLLLMDLETEEGVVGRSYLWCYFTAAMPAIASILEEVERVLAGDRVAPVDLWGKLAQRFALIGVQG